MLNIVIGENGKEIKVVAGGSLDDICADILCSLTVLYEQIEETYGKENADIFLTIIKDNLDLVKDRKALSEKAKDGVNKKDDKELLDEISELEEKIKKLKEEIKADDK